MPELPEVETVARDLRPMIVGATISGARCTWPRTLRSRDPDGFAAAIAGHRVEGVGRRGKLLLLALSGRLVLTIHLKMTGQLFVVHGGVPPDPHVRLVLNLADGRELRFRDIRKFGKVGLHHRDPRTGEPLTEPGGASAFAGLGPEPLDPAFTLQAFRRRVRRRSGRLKPLLLDQSFLAGVGNIYADEALWAARLHPLRSVASLRPPDEARLHHAIRDVLAEAVARRGSSVDDYTAPDGDGTMQERLLVYQRTGLPCARCGRPIRRMVVGARSTHFCSWCQRLPAADRKAAARALRRVTPAGRAIQDRGGRRPPTARAAGRWSELPGDPAIGLTPGEAALARLRARTDRTRAAAAARRARARDAGGGTVGAGPGAAG